MWCWCLWLTVFETRWTVIYRFLWIFKKKCWEWAKETEITFGVILDLSCWSSDLPKTKRLRQPKLCCITNLSVLLQVWTRVAYVWSWAAWWKPVLSDCFSSLILFSGHWHIARCGLQQSSLFGIVRAFLRPQKTILTKITSWDRTQCWVESISGGDIAALQPYRAH